MPPPLELMDRYQTALLWSNNGSDNYGEILIQTPVELTVRWIRKRKQVIDRDNNEVAVEATVVSAQRIPEGSIMWEGTLSEFLGTDSVDPALELMKVVVADDTPSIDFKHKRYENHLQFYQGTKPS